MSKEPDIWSRIEKVAPGVPDLTADNLKKMRQRGTVPPKWHYPLVTKAPDYGVRISYDELNKLQ
jgi:hypothetical protein